MIKVEKSAEELVKQHTGRLNIGRLMGRIAGALSNPTSRVFESLSDEILSLAEDMFFVPHSKHRLQFRAMFFNDSPRQFQQLGESGGPK